MSTTTADREPDAATGVSGISDEHRNGSITAIGIVLGFSLTFLATWAQGDKPWEVSGIPILLTLGLGITLQIMSLYRLLVLPNRLGFRHDLDEHNGASQTFLLGTCLVFAGFVLWVAIGMWRDLGG